MPFGGKVFWIGTQYFMFEVVLTVNNSTIPVMSEVNLLGVTYDNMLNFGEQVRSNKEKLQRRNNILKKIAGSDWGCAKETLTVTYKAIGRSVFNYGARIWASAISKTNEPPANATTLLLAQLLVV